VSRPVEYAIDLWDLRGLPPGIDVDELLAHLQDFGREGWELASITFNAELRGHGPSHLMIFTRPGG
jgi:hypothetical protein